MRLVPRPANITLEQNYFADCCVTLLGIGRLITQSLYRTVPQNEGIEQAGEYSFRYSATAVNALFDL